MTTPLRDRGHDPFVREARAQQVPFDGSAA